MNTTMTGFRWFSALHPCDLDKGSLSIGRAKSDDKCKSEIPSVYCISMDHDNTSSAHYKLYYICPCQEVRLQYYTVLAMIATI